MQTGLASSSTQLYYYSNLLFKDDGISTHTSHNDTTNKYLLKNVKSSFHDSKLWLLSAYDMILYLSIQLPYNYKKTATKVEN